MLLLNSNKIDKNSIEYVGIFNILNGMMYKISIVDLMCNDKNDENNLVKTMLDYIEKLIKKDIKNEREYDKMDLNFLKSYGKNIETEIEIKNENIQDEKFIQFTKQYEEIDNMHALNYDKHIICLDVETGTWSSVSDIIQLSYIIYDSSQNEIKRSNKYIKDRIVEKRAFDIHGISTEYLSKHGESYQDIMYEFLLDLKKTHVIVGHNISSDIRHLKSNMVKYHMNLNYDPFAEKQIDDTMRMDKMISSLNKTNNDKIKFLKLGELYKKLFNEPMKNAHDAIADCEATIKCYFELKSLEKQNDAKINDCNSNENIDDDTNKNKQKKVVKKIIKKVIKKVLVKGKKNTKPVNGHIDKFIICKETNDKNLEPNHADNPENVLEF